MIRTYGSMPTTMPAGFFKAIRFPVLAMMDKQTSDHRLLDSSGGGSRELPLSISAQFDEFPGHAGSELAGSLREVTFDPDTGVVSARGFLANDEVGRRYARAVHLGMMTGNSINLSDVEYRFEEDDTGDYRIRFTKWNVSKTVGVSTPAFAEAYAEVDALSDEELMASWGDPMEELVASFNALDVHIEGLEELEITASGGLIQSWDAFHRPESDKPQKIIVTRDGDIYGHVSKWNVCHQGIAEKCVITPRPPDGYASFNQPGVMTEKGLVETGPVFLLGGHPKKGKVAQEGPYAAYGGVENCWGDVRVTAGVHGPWVSGRVRPGTDDHAIYAARASRISGHWVDDKLQAIVSVNVPGYNLDGTGDGTLDFSAPFSAATREDGVLELAASFIGCEGDAEVVEEPVADSAVEFLDMDVEEIVRRVLAEARTANAGAEANPDVKQMLLSLLAEDEK